MGNFEFVAQLVQLLKFVLRSNLLIEIHLEVVLFLVRGHNHLLHLHGEPLDSLEGILHSFP